MHTRLYTLQHHEIIIDNPDRRYVLKIRDLPQEDKPRERLIAHGPSVLTTPELLAVVLGVGTKKEEVLTMANRIMKEYGAGGIMSQKSALTLAKDLDIPLGKAMQIVALAELGHRFFARNKASAPILRTAREVFEHVQSMCELSKEHMKGIYLDAHYRVIHEEVISIGTIDANIVHPREVFKPALDYSAAAVILVHNHPSGVVNPSEADIAVTKQLVEAGKLLGIDLIDHLVVATGVFRSVLKEYS
jgi:DNA repair protein RadC